MSETERVGDGPEGAARDRAVASDVPRGHAAPTASDVPRHPIAGTAISLTLPSDRRVQAGEKRKPLRSYERQSGDPLPVRRPDWLRARIPTGRNYLETKSIL
ncbi:MAG TPA: hypothetical protein VFT93_05515, partial [Candidatus Eisenbacteria bacterium]|nr:hypothetical protein [Candidatus Eisenbacteria bacterium]